MAPACNWLLLTNSDRKTQLWEEKISSPALTLQNSLASKDGGACISQCNSSKLYDFLTIHRTPIFKERLQNWEKISFAVSVYPSVLME
jgi:hypothetical protein